MTEGECILDTVRFFDEATHEWGYGVVCLNPDHGERECPGEHDIFRLKRED